MESNNPIAVTIGDKALIQSLVIDNYKDLFTLNVELKALHSICLKQMRYCLESYVNQKTLKEDGIDYKLKNYEINKFELYPADSSLNPCEMTIEVVYNYVDSDVDENKAGPLKRVKFKGHLIDLMTGVFAVNIDLVKKKNQGFTFKQTHLNYSDADTNIGVNLLNKYVELLIQIAIKNQERSQIKVLFEDVKKLEAEQS